VFYINKNATQRLACAPVILSVKQNSQRRFFLLLIGIALILASTMLLFNARSPYSWRPQWMLAISNSEVESSKLKDAKQYQQDLIDLKKEIEKINIERNIEAGIRHGLEKKIVELQKQLKNAELKLGFFNSR